MRRANPALFSLALGFFLAASLPSMAQVTPPINPRIPPPPPPPEVAKPVPVPEPAPLPKPLPEPPPPSLPAQVEIPSGTHIGVVLATPLSTRISRQGQLVVFTTQNSVQLADGLELPPETEFVGAVTEFSKPGGFGRAGKILVRVNRIRLPSGASAEVVARLDSAEADAIRRSAADNNRAADLVQLADWTLRGTVIGGVAQGGKGAAIGAGAGAAIGLIILMSHRGPDIYLEPGTPFAVILERPVSLPGSAVYAAQKDYERANARSARSRTPDSPAASEVEREPDEAVLDRDRPVLKRRPKRP